jgi:hypothetical protein
MSEQPPYKKRKNSPGASKEQDDEFSNFKSSLLQQGLGTEWNDATWLEFFNIAQQQEISPTVDTDIDGLEGLRHEDALLNQRQRLSQPNNSVGFHEKCRKAGCPEMTGRSAKNKSNPKGESFPLCQFCFDPNEHIRDWTRGGFFFGKNKTRKRSKRKTNRRKKKNKKSKKKRNKKTKKKKDRKWTDKSYPYRNVNNKDAIADFLSLRRMAKGKINPNSTLGNKTVDWGTEKARRKTKYRNHSFVEMWNRKDRRDKMMQFAKRIYKQGHSKTVLQAIKSAIDLQWGTVNTMRAAAAIHMYKKYEAKRVLDFTAGWGARMIAAMALDIDYIGIDSNKSLKPGYEKIIKLLKPYTKSKVKMIWSEAQKVDLSKVGKYDYVFTSPPYEYLEVYENMTNYEKKGSKISQPSSSKQIKLDDSAQFYDEFLVPTLKNAYKYLPKNKYICLNMPDIMYDKIKKRWKSVTKCDDYKIVKRTGGPKGKEDRRGKELIFCWKKR